MKIHVNAPIIATSEMILRITALIGKMIDPVKRKSKIRTPIAIHPNAQGRVLAILSMDYEVFLLSRIKEEHESGMANEDAVATGLQRSARIITAAAFLLAIAFAAFMTSGVSNIKTLGFGVAFAVLLDATVVRGLLVPALMRLFGERNWWAPEWIKRFTISH